MSNPLPPDGRVPRNSRTLATLMLDPLMTAALQLVAPYFAAAGRLTLLVAREKLGKSTLARAIAAAVSSGRLFLGLPTIQGPVLWLVLEELLGDVVTKLIAFKPNAAEVYLLQAALESRFAELQREVESVRPVLLIIDTLSSYAEGLVADENTSSIWTQLLNQLRRLAETHQLAVILLHHGTKRDGTYRGSTAIGASVDQIIEMHEGDDSSARLFRCRGRWDIPDFSVRLDTETNTYALEPSGGVVDIEAAGLAAKTRMRTWLAAHPESGKTDVTAQAGCRAADARKFFDEMVTADQIRVGVRGYVVTAPPESRAAA